MPEINLDATATHCNIVFADPPPGTFIAARGLPEKRADTKPYLIWIPADIDRTARNHAVFKFNQECAERGLAAYIVAGFTLDLRAGNADVTHIRCLVLDIDGGDIDAKAMAATACLGTASLCVWSGGKVDNIPKCHMYWTLSGDIEAQRVARLWGLAARAFGGDASFNLGRAHQPIRLAGSLHRKAEPVVVSIAYTSPTILDIDDAEHRLEAVSLVPNQGPANSGRSYAPQRDEQMSLFARNVSLDELINRHIGPGESEVNRFEALTRIAGMYLNNLHDANDNAACEREYGYYRQWCITHLEHVERDYDLRLHWRKLLQRERWKRNQPRLPRARSRFFRRG